MHPVIYKSSQLILAGDIAGAEKELVAIAEQSGDNALMCVLDDVPPKDLLAIMREFDSSRESVVNMLVSAEQFARAIVLEIKYGDRTGEKLRAVMNAVIHSSTQSVSEYLEAIYDIEGGSETLANYFEDRYDEIICFATTGIFTPEFDFESLTKTHNSWLMERIDELDEGLIFGDSIKDARPVISRDEVCDGDWMETAWVLRYELPDAFEEVMTILRGRIQKHLDKEVAFATPTAAEEDADDSEESAI